MISVVKPDADLDANPSSVEEESPAGGRVSDEEERERDRVESSEAGNGLNPSRVKVSEQEEEREEELGVFELKNVVFEDENERIDPKEESFSDDGGSRSSDTKGEAYSSLLSEFDDFVANEKNGAMVGTSRALSFGFEIGDMVWGKVKSHPWWPGHIFNEAFATSSVRRTRREGHVLVAFFGDSSYGWFDPAELIPFDPYFTEKSQQTTARNFVRAVEEAADEASRRRAIGLVCKCRNVYNFRPSKVEGYFVVDVPDYEQGVYSAGQIKKARDDFQPLETLAFVKQLALAPGVYDRNTINFIKDRATIFAFRKAVFEEFDETYAQAFGVPSFRQSSFASNATNQQVKLPTRAPLSGPLVIAETLGVEKSSKKAMKVKDHTKKERYLLKRRDEPSEMKALQIGQMQASSSGLAVYVEDSSAVAEGEFVLQKRTVEPNIFGKNEQTDVVSRKDAGLSPSEHASGKEAAAVSLGALATQGPILDRKPSTDEGKAATQETRGRLGADVAASPTGAGGSDLQGKGLFQSLTDSASASLRKDTEARVDLKYEESQLNEGSQQAEPSFSPRADGDGSVKPRDGFIGLHPAALNAKHPFARNAVDGVKKVKVSKRPLEDMSSEKPMIGEKKKKKKKELGSEVDAGQRKKRSAFGNVIQKKKDTGGNNALLNYPGTHPVVGFSNIELNVPHLMNDLYALALDPFHAAESSPTVATQFFLQFRSLVFQKSLVLSPPSETEAVEVRARKSSSSAGPSVNAAGENSRITAHKVAKPLVRSEDPTIAGRKRLPSDRQEEIAAKRLKKVTQLKSLAAEKRVGLKTSEIQQVEGKEAAAPGPPRSVRPDSFKRTEPSTRAAEPTMLVMKFPPGTSLPSVAELKARFARFGPIDQSAIRVFWKSSQCRVVFRRKLDAQAAYKYAIGNSSLFGNVSVRYSIREVGAPATEASEYDKGRGEDAYIDGARTKDPLIERPAQVFEHQPLSQSTVQPKSILKKPAGEEAVQVIGGRGAPRVKFMLGGEETNREEQLMVGSRNSIMKNNASFGDGGQPATSVAMEFSSMNFQKVVAPSPSIHSLPPQFAKSPLVNSHHTEVPPRNMHNFNAPSAPVVTPSSVDISQQMLSLLTRCNDVVTNVTGFLGYVPYHPL